jgi:hypothetical protein
VTDGAEEVYQLLTPSAGAAFFFVTIIWM